MSQYGLDYRGKHITVLDSIHPEKGGIACVVQIGDDSYPDIKGIPFATVGATQAAGDAVAHQGYFIRASSLEQRDGSWVGSYQLHRNDNPMPFRRAVCDTFRGNTSAEAEEHAVGIAMQVLDAEVAAGKL